MWFSVYTTLVFRNLHHVLKGVVDIHETKKKSNYLYLVVQDGMILSKQPLDAIFSVSVLLVAEKQVIL